MSDHKPTAEENELRAAHGVSVQPDPIPNDRPSSHDRVIELFERRKAFGLAKYGTPLQAGNGRDHLQDILDEMADAMVYLQTEIDERALAGVEDASATAWVEGYSAAYDHLWSVLQGNTTNGVWQAIRSIILNHSHEAPECPYGGPR